MPFPGDVDVPTDDRDIERLLRDRKHGPPYPFESTPWDFARRWGDATVRARVWPIASRLLTDDDDLVRARALELAETWGEGRDVTVPRVLEIGEQHRALFAAQAPEGIPLRQALAQTLSNVADVTHGPRIAGVLRAMTREASPPVGASVLGRYEPAFVIEQAARLGDAHADWLERAAGSLALWRRDSVLPLLHASRALSPERRALVLAAVESHMQRNDDDARAVARSYELPAPSLPAPSVDECKQSLGLV